MKTILFIFLFMCSHSGDYAEINAQVESNKRPTVQWTRSEKNTADGEFEFHFSISAGKRIQQVKLHNMTTEVRAAELVDNTLVIVGSIGTTASTVTLVDVNTGKEKDMFLCYEPILSDVKKYIAFKRFYPRFSEPPLTSDVVVLYRLQASPSENRRLSRDKHSSTPDGDVGFPVYPPRSSTDKNDSWIENPRERHFINLIHSAEWGANDTFLRFKEFYDCSEWLVTIDLANGLLQAAIDKHKLGPTVVPQEVCTK